MFFISFKSSSNVLLFCKFGFGPSSICYYFSRSGYKFTSSFSFLTFCLCLSLSLTVLRLFVDRCVVEPLSFAMPFLTSNLRDLSSSVIDAEYSLTLYTSLTEA